MYLCLYIVLDYLHNAWHGTLCTQTPTLSVHTVNTCTYMYRCNYYNTLCVPTTTFSVLVRGHVSSVVYIHVPVVAFSMATKTLIAIYFV